MLHFISVALHMSAFHLTFNFCAFHFAKGHINSCPLDQSPIEQKVEKPEELLRCTGHSLDDIIAIYNIYIYISLYSKLCNYIYIIKKINKGTVAYWKCINLLTHILVCVRNDVHHFGDSKFVNFRIERTSAGGVDHLDPYLLRVQSLALMVTKCHDPNK